MHFRNRLSLLITDDDAMQVSSLMTMTHQNDSYDSDKNNSIRLKISALIIRPLRHRHPSIRAQRTKNREEQVKSREPKSIFRKKAAPLASSKAQEASLEEALKKWARRTQLKRVANTPPLPFPDSHGLPASADWLPAAPLSPDKVCGAVAFTQQQRGRRVASVSHRTNRHGQGRRRDR